MTEPADRRPAFTDFGALVDGVAVGLAVVDPEGRLVHVNAAYCAMHGATAEQLLGRPVLDLVVAEDRPGDERPAPELLAGDVAHVVMDERHVRLDDGSVRWVQVTVAPLWDDDGSLAYLVATCQDVTPLARARAASRRASEQLASTLENISDGVVTYDRDWRITYLNPAFEQMTGLDRSQLLGEVLWEALPQLVGTEVERTYRHAAITGEAVVIDRFLSTRDGRTYRLSVLPATDGGLTVYLRDISAEVEEAQRLRTLAAAEHQAAEELRSVDRMKNTFITAVSHELRTPLTVVRGMADTLLRLRDSPDVALRARVEDALAEHARRLNVLLDELLDTDRLVRGSLAAVRERVELPALVQRVLDESAVAHRALVRMPASLVAQVDPVLVERSVRNLLENAAKYAPDGVVLVQVDDDDRGGFVLAVSDDGPGIPSEHAERIFEPFHRVLDHHQPGTGIGLSLVAEFARLHGGRAWADTDRDRGARIVVEVPAAS